MFQYRSYKPSEEQIYPFMEQMGYPYCYLPPQPIQFCPPYPYRPDSHFISNFIPQNITQCAQNAQKDLANIEDSLGNPNFINIKQTKQNEAYKLEQREEQNKKCFKQKFGRNIYSNIFHLMVNFVKNQKPLKGVVAKIIQQNQMNITVSQFCHLFKYNSYRLKSYASITKIKQFWRGPSITQETKCMKLIKEVECAKIFRIISKKYLVYHHLPYIFNSLKIKMESKRLHTGAIRKILNL